MAFCDKESTSAQSNTTPASVVIDLITETGKIDPTASQLSTDDFKALLEISTARIACIEFPNGWPLSKELLATPPAQSEVKNGATLDSHLLAQELYLSESFCIEGSDALAHSLGLKSFESARGKSLREIFPPSLGYESIFERWIHRRCSRESFEGVALDRYGSRTNLQAALYTSAYGSSSDNSKNRRLWVVFRDVSIHTRAVSALADIDKHYRSLIETTNSYVFRLDSSEELVYASDSLLNVLQTPDSSASKQLAKIKTILQTSAQKEIFKSDLEVEMRLSEPVIFPDGSEYLLSRKPARNSENEVEYTDYLFTPLIPQQKTEYSTSSIIAVATGIAHDFNNHLTAVLGQMDIGLSQLAPDNPAISALLVARSAVQSASLMTKELLALGKTASTPFAPINMTELVGSTTRLVCGNIPANTNLRVDVGARQLFVYGNAGHLQRVLTNLIVNARDSMNGQSGPGNITVTLRAEKNQILLSVKDSGSGIPEDLIGRIFERSFTTKDLSGGSGIGLSISKAMIESHGGSVEVKSVVGLGSTFTVSLPLAGLTEQGESEIPKPSGINSVDLKGCSILIAEDDEMVRSMLLTALTSAGCKVNCVTDGQELLIHLKKQKTAYDVILIDDSMPKVRGLETLLTLQEFSPSSRLILTSGDPSVKKQLKGELSTVSFLSKPFDVSELISKIF